jgi:ketosteroid isomerase-like protein
MKQLLLLIVISISLHSCKDETANKEKDNLEIAKKFMKAVESKDVATMDFLLAENYIGYGPSVGDSTTKKEAVKAFKFNAENLYESFEYTKHKEIAVSSTEGEAMGDWVLNWAYLTIKYKDGRGPINLWVNAVYRIENGKIVHSRTFYNEADALRQLGFSFEAPAGE